MPVLSKRIQLALCLLLSVSCQSIMAQSADPRESIRAAVEAGDWQTATTEVTRLQRSDPTRFQTMGYEYLLGRLAEKTGDIAGATSRYQAILAHNSSLSAYAMWHLSHIARANGDLALEREYLRRLVSSAPLSLLFDAAVLRLAESFFESGDYSGAADSVRPATLARNPALAREATALMGQSLLRAGKATDAREVFSKLLMQMPDASRPDDFALTAARELDALDKQSLSGSAQQLTEADHLLRASVYQFNRDFAAARSHYQAIVDGYPQSGTLPNAIYQLGRGLYLEGRYDEAIRYFQKAFDQFPQTTSARDALSYLGSSYLRLKRTDDAITAYKLFIDRFPDAPAPERPYLNIIDALHEAGRYPEALSWVQQTRTRFKNDLGGALALFGQMRVHMAQGAWQQAVSDADELVKLTDLGGTKVPGGTTVSEVNFLRAYALEQLGRTDEAITAYLSIPDGRNEYYGARATRRLLALATNDKARALVQARLKPLFDAARMPKTNGQVDQTRLAAQSSLRLTPDPKLRAEMINYLRTAYELLPAYNLPSLKLLPIEEWLRIHQPPPEAAKEKSNNHSLAAELATLGLYDEAMPEFFAARAVTAPANPKSGDASAGLAQNSAASLSDDAYTVAVYSLRGGIANRAVRFGEQAWRNVPVDYMLELAPREMVELLYPAPHRESLLSHAPKRNVDPRFVLAIARQESRYQADAKSVAAARGMMQFIPATANEIATQLKLSNFVQDDLYNPDTAILFGSQYLANLYQQFPDQPDAVAAAYNGGAENMARWKARSRANDPDRFVSEIGFSQTKDYVYRVMTNFWNYQRLYDAQFRPQISLTK